MISKKTGSSQKDTSGKVEMWSDEHLVALVQQDDQTAFEQIYNKYWSKLYLSAYNMVRDKEVAEDIVQDVLVSLWVRRASLSVVSLNSFLYSAVRYQVFKVFKSGKIPDELFHEASSQAAVNAGEGALVEKDINHLLSKGIADLPEKCRQIFLLSRTNHLSTKEIAAWLGVAPKTVENQLTIALHRLRTTLGEFLILAAFLLSLP
ncbi:RNA polymerase sigma-70 factor [Rufibacter immobilis]|uniref:RNA polymerase sigma-70 factor n=1 Tax=Rufibacter immobilis TaxID=1348778 RepID=UPI0035F02D26